MMAAFRQLIVLYTNESTCVLLLVERKITNTLCAFCSLLVPLVYEKCSKYHRLKKEQ